MPEIPRTRVVRCRACGLIQEKNISVAGHTVCMHCTGDEFDPVPAKEARNHGQTWPPEGMVPGAERR